MNIFITGSSGFVGKHLIKELLLLKHRIKGFDLHPADISDSNYSSAGGNICNKKVLLESMKADKVDIIVHLAAKHHDYGVTQSEFFNINEGGTRNVAEAAAECGANKILFFSSVAVYGSQETLPREDSICNPTSPYGRSKLAAEHVLEEWIKENSRRQVLILRPAVIFGPENYANMYHLITKICENKFIFTGKGNNIKSIAYIDNLVAACTFLMKAFRPGIDYFNYADEPQVSIREIVETISGYANVAIPKIRFPFLLSLILASPFDILEKVSGRFCPITANRIKKFNTETFFPADKIRRAGFTQPVLLSDGFERTVKWFKQHKSIR